MQNSKSKKRIVVMYTSVGMGHKLIGQSIAKALRKNPDLEVSELDFIKQNESPLTRNFEKAYIYVLTQAGWFWAAIYKSNLFNKLTLPLRVPFAAAKSKKLERYLKKHQPDAVVTTQTTASATMSALKRSGKYKSPLIISFTDFHFHPYWFYKEADRILVQTEEHVEILMTLGYPREKIVVTGMPVNDAYDKQHPTGEIYQNLKLSRAKPIVLVMGGSRGWGIREKDVEELLKTKYNIQLVILTGTDQAQRLRLIKMVEGHDIPARVFGFLPNSELAKLFQVARVLVTKPGGSTLGEALASQLPMVLANPLPAMEEMNQEFIMKQGAAVQAKSSIEIRLWVERLLQDKKFYSELKERMRELNQPDAARLAAEAIIDML